jgi:hypothetical protein
MLSFASLASLRETNYMQFHMSVPDRQDVTYLTEKGNVSKANIA